MRSCRSRAMRVRSSSAPTVRSRPNQRALSMARATGSTKPLSSSRSRPVKWRSLVCSTASTPMIEPRAGEHGVEARAGLGASPGPPRSAEVRGADHGLAGDGRADAAAGRSSVASLAGSRTFSRADRPASCRRCRRRPGWRPSRSRTGPAAGRWWCRARRRGRARPAASGSPGAARTAGRWRRPGGRAGRGRGSAGGRPRPRCGGRSRRRGPRG